MSNYEIQNGAELLRFALYCTTAGGIVFLIDLLACKIRSTQSLLGIVFTKENTFFLFALWSVGAGLMGLIGAYAEVFQLTKPSVISVGFTWPFLLSKVVKNNINGASRDAAATEADEEEHEQN